MPLVLYQVECLKENYIYVGIARNPEKRFRDHFSGTGSKFTKKYGVKSIKIISSYELLPIALLAENNHVNWLMQELPDAIICGGARNSANLSDLLRYRRNFNSRAGYFFPEQTNQNLDPNQNLCFGYDTIRC
jgi:predicted GIY-YIG superfamily endonuclease